MDEKKLQYFKNKLLNQKHENLELLKNKQSDESMNLLDSELSLYDNHPADIATEVYMIEQEEGYKSQVKTTLGKIEKSLEDIENNKYGICDNCNQEIKLERLELIPYTKTCLKCSEKDSDSKNIDDRKTYESLNHESFNIESKDKYEQTGYDMEDAYQDVLQDNFVEKDPSLSTGDNIGIMDEDKSNDADTVEEVEGISEEYYRQTLE